MFNYTEADKLKVIEGYFINLEPPRLRLFPPKQKKKYIALTIIVKVLEENMIYSEKELNIILKEIYPDFVSIRRALVDYRFMERTKDGSQYWVKKKD